VVTDRASPISSRHCLPRPKRAGLFATRVAAGQGSEASRGTITSGPGATPTSHDASILSTAEQHPSDGRAAAPDELQASGTIGASVLLSGDAGQRAGRLGAGAPRPLQGSAGPVVARLLRGVSRSAEPGAGDSPDRGRGYAAGGQSDPTGTYSDPLLNSRRGCALLARCETRPLRKTSPAFVSARVFADGGAGVAPCGRFENRPAGRSRRTRDRVARKKRVRRAQRFVLNGVGSS